MRFLSLTKGFTLTRSPVIRGKGSSSSRFEFISETTPRGVTLQRAGPDAAGEEAFAEQIITPEALSTV